MSSVRFVKDTYSTAAVGVVVILMDEGVHTVPKGIYDRNV